MNERERMVISAHNDAEVEAPWKATIEQKISEDPEWAAEADLHARVSAVLARSPEPNFDEARQRVWSHLAARAPRTVMRLPVAWISVAAAALVLLAAGGGYWAGRSASGPAAVAEIQVQVPQQLELKLSGEGQLLMASTLEGPRR